MKKSFKKGLCVTLGAAMLATMLPMVDFTEEAKAEGTRNVNDVNLGTYGWENPTTPDSLTDSWSDGKGTYVYFGQYAQSDTTGATKEPIKWRVLDIANDSNNTDDDNTADSVLLFADNVLDIQYFNESRDDGNVWADSDLRMWLNSIDGWTTKAAHDGGFLDTAFNSAEQNAISDTYLDESDDQVGLYTGFNGADINGDKVFVISIKELQSEKYGFLASKCTDSNGDLINNHTLYVAKTSYLLGKASRHWGFYWTRSPHKSNDTIVGIIDAITGTSGTAYNTYYVDDSPYYTLGVVPEINLNYDSVLFTTAAGMTKGEFGVVGGEFLNNEWNVTILEGTDFEASRKPAELGSLAPGEKVTIEVTNIPELTSGNEYTQISAILVDENDNILEYGKISDTVETGEIEVTISTMIPEGDYRLFVFAEDVNSSADLNTVDYASNMVEIDLVVAEIETVEITGIDAVVAGGDFDLTAGCETEGVVETDVTVSWKNGEEDVTGTADYATEYTAVMTLSAKEGYGFTEATTATVDGNEATVVLNEDGTITVTYVYTTEEAPEVTPTPEATPEVTPDTEATPDDGQNDTPATGDTTSVMMLIVMMVAAGFGIVIAIKRAR